MAGTPMKSSQLQQVVIAGGEILGDVDEQLKLLGDVDKQMKVSDAVNEQVHHLGREGQEVRHTGDVDEQRQVWEAMDENKQIWDAVDEQRKLKMLEEKRKKQQERREKKQKKIVSEPKRKELKKKRKKPVLGRGSPAATYLSQRVTTSLFVRSPRVNMLGSSLRVLAEVAASKREMSLSTRAESSSHGVIPEVTASKRVRSYLANSIPVILDPRFKYGFIEFRLKQAFGSDVANHLGKVKAALDSLFKEYSSQMSKSTNEPTQEEKIHEVVMEENNPLAGWDQHLSMKQRQPKNELDIYLQEETFPRIDDFDILQWWSLHSSKYPVLARITRDVLAIPASVVPSESAFSTGQRVISDYRSRLKDSWFNVVFLSV